MKHSVTNFGYWVLGVAIIVATAGAVYQRRDGRPLVGLGRLVSVQHKDANGQARRNTSAWWDKDRQWECSVWDTVTGLRCLPSKHLGSMSSWYSDAECSKGAQLADIFDRNCDIKFAIDTKRSDQCGVVSVQQVYRVAGVYEGEVWRQMSRGMGDDGYVCRKDLAFKPPTLWRVVREDISAEFAGVEEVHP